MAESLEKRLLSVLNENGSDTFAKEDLYEYKAIFLTKVLPDDSNPRFFPSIIISDTHAYQFSTRKITKQQLINIYDGKNKVLIGQSCIVNCFSYGSPEWKKANETIDSIIELAENIAITEVIQAPTIYPLEDGHFRILTGHRRFFAIIFNSGVDSVAHFKVYHSQPLLFKTKQFQENSAREDLSQHGKLIAFQSALREVEILNESKKRLGQKTLTVRETASLLGISMGAYDNYNVLTRYPSVIDSFDNGNSEPMVSVKKLILKTEKAYKKKHGINTFNIHDRKEINKLLESILDPNKKSKKLTNLKPDEPNKDDYYKLGKIESSYVMKTILQNNICEIDCGVNWQAVNWDDHTELNKALKRLIEHLSANEQSLNKNETN